jgi:hypothetical protein
MKQAMVCIGITREQDHIKAVARQAGRVLEALDVAGDGKGLDALRHFITRGGLPVRLAVASGALSLAMALGSVPGREIVLVAPSAADNAPGLARFAEHLI